MMPFISKLKEPNIVNEDIHVARIEVTAVPWSYGD